MGYLNSVLSISALAVMIMINGCSRRVSSENTKESSEPISTEKVVAGPPAIIYKTKADYFDKVPVMLSPDRSQIASYPSQRDVMSGDDFLYPTKLDNGFLLDNRGINEFSAFLSLTYEEYSALKEEITTEFLFEKILDSDPFVEMYRCGSKFQYRDIVAELNQKINSNDFSDCQKLK